MTTKTPSESLAEVLRLSELATPDKWRATGQGNHANVQTDDVYVCDGRSPSFMQPADAQFIAAAVNFIRHHAAKYAEMERDAVRLDWLEHTFNAVTTQERYLPLRMIWGKGCNGRTLREAADKYMARESATNPASRGDEGVG